MFLWILCCVFIGVVMGAVVYNFVLTDEHCSDRWPSSKALGVGIGGVVAFLLLSVVAVARYEMDVNLDAVGIKKDYAAAKSVWGNQKQSYELHKKSQAVEIARLHVELANIKVEAMEEQTSLERKVSEATVERDGIELELKLCKQGE